MDYGGLRCAKYLLYFTNVLIIVLAFVTLGFGIWMSSDIASFLLSMTRDVDPTGVGIGSLETTIAEGVSRTQTVANILITSGVFALLIGLLGIWAAYRSSKSLLLAYGIILTVVVLLELGAGIAWAVDKPKIIDGLGADYGAALANYDYIQTATDANNRIIPVRRQFLNNNTMPATALINMMQTMVGCCGGAHGYTDFSNAPYWTKARGQAPVYCCKLSDTRQLILEDPDCAQIRTPNNSWMNVGCSDKIQNWIRENSGSIVGVAVGIGLIDFLGIVAAFYQYYCITQGYKEF